MNIGLLGELDVEAQLIMNGWHPIRLDTAQMASNADLIAINRSKRVMIQVKTTDGHKSTSHGDFLGFGYSSGFLNDGTPLFNSKNSPLIADVVIGVQFIPGNSRFVVLPVGLAEKICQLHCTYWYNIPTRTSRGKRSSSFPIYLAFVRTPKSHFEHHSRIQRNLKRYENAWHVLDIDPEKLRDPNEWQIHD